MALGQRFTTCRVARVAAVASLVVLVARPQPATAATRLTDAAASGESVTTFQLQGAHAAVMVGPGKAEPNHLLGVALDGSTPPLVLNDPSVPGADPLYIGSFKFKPDEAGVVLFRGQDQTSTPVVTRHFQASVVAPLLTRGLTDAERRIYFEATTLESDYAYEYVVRPDGGGIQQIYRVPMLGDGPELQLTAHTRSGTTIQSWRLSPGEEFLQYRADGETATTLDLYSVPTDGSGPAARVSAVNSSSDVGSWISTADGSRTTFRVDDPTAGTRKLYIAPSDGSEPAERLDAPVHGDQAEFIDFWRFTPDESRVLYVTRSPAVFAGAGLYSVSTTDPAGDHFRVSSRGFGYGRSISEMFLTPDGARTVYSGRFLHYQADDLFAASTTEPGTQIQLNTRNTPQGDVGLVRLIQNGGRVVYRGDMDTPSHFELYSAATDQTGTQIRISGPVANSAGSILSYRLSPDEMHVVYDKRSPGRDVDYLFSAETSTADSEVVLLRNDTYTQVYFAPQIDPSSNWVVVESQTTSQANAIREWLFAVPIDGGVPVRLNEPVPERGTIGKFEFTPDGLGVAFTATREIRPISPGTCPLPVPCQGGQYVSLSEMYVAALPAESGLLGDMDGNGVVDADDLNPFALGMVNPQGFAFQFGLAPVNFGDMNEDGQFNALDAPLFAAEAGVDVEQLLSTIARAGDYNGDGVVDTADYAVWRDAEGAPAGTLPNDVNGGAIGNAQYFTWKANFGAQAGGGASAAVPEPAAAWLLTAVAAAMSLNRLAMNGRRLAKAPQRSAGL